MAIDLSMLAGLPGLVAIFVCLRKGPEYAFLNVYLPVLLLLPDECRMPLSGQLNFSDSAIIPIAAFYLWREGRNWEFSLTDGLVLAFTSLVTISEYKNADYWLAQHVALGLITTIILPYMVAKGLIMREKMGVAVAKRIAILAAVVVVLSVYEFRMTTNPFVSLLSSTFPGISEIPSFRYGLVRIRGPWNHPILAGMILVVAFRTARWLEWSDNWRGNIPFLPISKVRLCEITLVVGSVITLSRGPWVGAIVASAIMMLVKARQRTYVTVLAIFAAFIVAVPLYSAFDSYLSTNRSGVDNEAQESAVYRRELLEQYVVIAEERLAWGWGSNEIGRGLYPTIDGMDSIDNQYLLLALHSGVYALVAMVLLLLWVPVRLFGFSLRHSRDDPNALLAITLMGIFVVLGVSIFTAWLGAQTQPLLFMIAGWSEGMLVAPLLMTVKVPVTVPARRVGYGFQRVMV